MPRGSAPEGRRTSRPELHGGRGMPASRTPLARSRDTEPVQVQHGDRSAREQSSLEPAGSPLGAWTRAAAPGGAGRRPGARCVGAVRALCQTGTPPSVAGRPPPRPADAGRPDDRRLARRRFAGPRRRRSGPGRGTRPGTPPRQHAAAAETRARRTTRGRGPGSTTARGRAPATRTPEDATRAAHGAAPADAHPRTPPARHTAQPRRTRAPRTLPRAPARAPEHRPARSVSL